jgi:hypothetical protein
VAGDDGFWDDATVVFPEPKEAVSLRVDRDVLEWFRDGGPRYQTRMTARASIVRPHDEAEGEVGGRPSPLPLLRPPPQEVRERHVGAPPLDLLR